MVRLVKTAHIIQDVNIIESNIADSTAVISSERTQRGNNFIEHATPNFENKSAEANFKFLVNNENNPVIVGLHNLNILALGISGKSFNSLNAFNNNPVYSTPQKMRTASDEEAINIVLTNMDIISQVKSGVRKKLYFATQFNNLALLIAKDVKMGNPIVEKYKDKIVTLIKDVIVEWRNHG